MVYSPYTYIVGKNLLLDNILNKIFIFNYQTRAGNLLNFYTQHKFLYATDKTVAA